MPDDPELLRRYAKERSEPAFAEFVGRHVDLVYSAAVRRLNGDAHRAADVTQQVFVAAARHAGSLAGRAVVTGWLYTATRNAAVDMIRRERRRQAAEAEMRLMNEANEPAAREEDWTRLRPQLDAALDQLTEREREALLLRFFENRSYPEMGARCAIAADAARMRVDRALEKLHAVLGRQGVASTSAALAVLLAQQSVSAAPAGLASLATSAALAPGAAATTVGVLGFMSSTKLAIGVGGTLVAFAIGTASYQVKSERAAQKTAGEAVARRESAAAELRAVKHEAAAALAAAQTASAARSADAAQAAPHAGSAPAVGGAGKPSMLAKLQAKGAPGRGRAGGPAGGAITTDAAGSDPAANGAQLLANNPDLKAVYDKWLKAAFDANWGPLVAQLKLSPDQAAQFQQLVNSPVMQMTQKSGSYQFGAPPDADTVRSQSQQLAELLGDDGMQQYRAFAQARQGTVLANQVAGAAAAMSVPLTPTQMTSLTGLLAGFSPGRADGFDWDGAAGSAGGFLSPQQVEAFKAVANQVQVNSQVLPPPQMQRVQVSPSKS